MAHTFTTRSTATSGSIHADVCSQCHPFYTGKQKILDTGGRVARFEARYAKKAADRRRDEVARTGAGRPLRRGAGARVRGRRRPVTTSEEVADVRGSRGPASPSTPSSRRRLGRARDPRRPAPGQAAQPALRRADRRSSAPSASWQQLGDDLEAARELAAEDPAFAAEADGAGRRGAPSAEERLRRLLVPRDPTDAKDAILEVKSGEGGEESALFAGDLLRMYTRYAERARLEDRGARRHRVRPRRLQVA